VRRTGGPGGESGHAAFRIGGTMMTDITDAIEFRRTPCVDSFRVIVT